MVQLESSIQTPLKIVEIDAEACHLKQKNVGIFDILQAQYYENMWVAVFLLKTKIEAHVL